MPDENGIWRLYIRIFTEIGINGKKKNLDLSRNFKKVVIGEP